MSVFLQCVHEVWVSVYTNGYFGRANVALTAIVNLTSFVFTVIDKLSPTPSLVCFGNCSNSLGEYCWFQWSKVVCTNFSNTTQIQHVGAKNNK